MLYDINAWKTFGAYHAVTKTWQVCSDVFFLTFPRLYSTLATPASTTSVSYTRLALPIEVVFAYLASLYSGAAWPNSTRSIAKKFSCLCNVITFFVHV